MKLSNFSLKFKISITIITFIIIIIISLFASNVIKLSQNKKTAQLSSEQEKLIGNYKINVDFQLSTSDVETIERNKKQFINNVKQNIINDIYQKLNITKEDAFDRITILLKEKENYQPVSSTTKKYELIVIYAPKSCW